MCKNSLSPALADKFAALEAYIADLNITRDDARRRGRLIQVLHRAQQIFGYLPREVQCFVAEKMYLQEADVSGVVSFYNYFTTKPKGKYCINVCLGTACYVKGAGDIMDKLSERLGIGAEECTPDGKFSLTACRCIGACGLAPVLTVNEEVYGRLTKNDVDDILAKYAD